jgi:transcriptional regulator with XRE-family HTH domain
MDINTKVAARIKELRIQKNILQKYIAEGLGITENTYSRIENGHTQITINNLFVICEKLGVSVLEALEVADRTIIENNKNLVMNNVNHGHLHINMSAEEFKRVMDKIKDGLE